MWADGTFLWLELKKSLKKNKQEICSYSDVVTTIFFCSSYDETTVGFNKQKFDFFKWRIFCWSWPKIWEGVGNTVVPVQCLVYDDDDNRRCPRTRVTRPIEVTNNKRNLMEEARFLLPSHCALSWDFPLPSAGAMDPWHFGTDPDPDLRISFLLIIYF